MVLSTLFIAIQIPDIELVLGIVGSTIGTVICILFPVSMFIKMVNANTTERLVAQAIFVIGVIVLVLGTYVTLYEADSKHADNQKNVDPGFIAPRPLAIKPDVIDPQVVMPPVTGVDLKLSSEKSINVEKKDNVDKIESKSNVEVRQEPIQPLPPNDDVIKKEELVPSASTESKKESTSKENVEKIAEESIKEKQKELDIREQQANKLIKELKVQKKEHEQIIKEQKEVLEQLKEHIDADKALESNAAQKLNIDNTNLIQNKQQQIQNIQPESRGIRPQVQVPEQNLQAQIPVVSNQLNQQQPLQPNDQLQNVNNPSPLRNQNSANVQPAHSKLVQSDSQQAININQQAGAQNQPLIQQQNFLPQQLAQNQPVLQQQNYQPQQMSQNQPVMQQQNYQPQQVAKNEPNSQGYQKVNMLPNQAAQQSAMQNMAYQSGAAPVINHVNQQNMLQQQVVQNQSNFGAQQLAYQVVGQNPQAQSVGNEQKAHLYMQDQNPELALNQKQFSTQRPIIGNVLHTQDKKTNGNSKDALNNQNNPVKTPDLQVQQQNFKQRFENNQGNSKEYQNNNTVIKNSNLKQSSGASQFKRQNSVINRNSSPQSNLKYSIDNKYKVDVKREIDESSKPSSNSEKLKAPGRDLKEAKLDAINYNDYNSLNTRKVKRNVDNDYSQDYKSDTPKVFAKSSQEHLNTISVA